MEREMEASTGERRQRLEERERPSRARKRTGSSRRKGRSQKQGWRAPEEKKRKGEPDRNIDHGNVRDRDRDRGGDRKVRSERQTDIER